MNERELEAYIDGKKVTSFDASELDDDNTLKLSIATDCGPLVIDWPKDPAGEYVTPWMLTKESIWDLMTRVPPRHESWRNRPALL